MKLPDPTGFSMAENETSKHSYPSLREVREDDDAQETALDLPELQDALFETVQKKMQTTGKLYLECVISVGYRDGFDERTSWAWCVWEDGFRDFRTLASKHE